MKIEGNLNGRCDERSCVSLMGFDDSIWIRTPMETDVMYKRPRYSGSRSSLGRRLHCKLPHAGPLLLDNLQAGTSRKNADQPMKCQYRMFLVSRQRNNTAGGAHRCVLATPSRI